MRYHQITFNGEPVLICPRRYNCAPYRTYRVVPLNYVDVEDFLELPRDNWRERLAIGLGRLEGIAKYRRAKGNDSLRPVGTGSC